MSELLCIEGLRAGYGEAVVLPHMSLRLADSQVLALLGRNGTGKTTLINSIVGITRRFGGSISLGGRDISAMRPDQRARAGIGWVPQERNIFRSLTVEEKILVHHKERAHLQFLFHPAHDFEQLVAGLEEVYELSFAPKEGGRRTEIAPHGTTDRGNDSGCGRSLPIGHANAHDSRAHS